MYSIHIKSQNQKKKEKGYPIIAETQLYFAPNKKKRNETLACSLLQFLFYLGSINRNKK